MNEIVKYDNYMNSLKFKGFTSTDFNFLMVLCNKLRNKDVSEITISFDELREKTDYKQTATNKFVSDLERMNKKLMEITCRFETESKIIMFVLFPTFIIDIDRQLLRVSVNKDFKFILNELVKNFTRFELREFVELDSKYSKTLYRLLKQYRSTGHYEVNIEEFKKIMDYPETYTSKYIMDKIIKPSIDELDNKSYFQNLQCEPKYARKRGKPVTGYIFTFAPEDTGSREDYSKETRAVPEKNKKSKNGYTNFSQRTYDYEELEKELLNQNISDKK